LGEKKKERSRDLWGKMIERRKGLGREEKGTSKQLMTEYDEEE
jgi:hypothetical protein